MKAYIALLATLQLLAPLVVAHPFIIIHTKIISVQGTPTARPTLHYEKRQGILDDIESFFGGGGEETTTSAKASATTAKATLVPPATVAAPTTKEPEDPKPTSTKTDGDEDDDDENEDNQTTTSSEESTSTDTESATSTTDSSTSTTADPSTSTPSITVTSPATSTLDSATSGPTKSAAESGSETSDSSSDGIPPSGIAVAILMTLLILTLTAWLIFKFHPKSQAWWAAREERLYNERSYRDAIDGPGSSVGSPGLGRTKTIKSFFVPKTAHLGGGREIKRKPVNWGVESVPGTPRVGGYGEADSEKIAMTSTAAPIGSIERWSRLPGHTSTTTHNVTPPVSALTKNASITATTRPVSPVSAKGRESLERLAPISPLSMHRELPAISRGAEWRDLPPLPGVPSLPGLVHAKRGSDGVFKLM